MLNLTLEQVMQYAKDYKAVPVVKECKRQIKPRLTNRTI